MRFAAMAFTLVALLAVQSIPCLGGDAEARRDGGKGGRDNSKDSSIFLTAVPKTKGSVILGRPSNRSVVLSALLEENAKVKVSYGKVGEGLSKESGPFELKAGQPAEILLDGLDADSSYEYRIADFSSGSAILPESGAGSFHTCRPPGASFTFTVTADSHLDEHSDAATYLRTLANAKADSPDFHIDLGDTFMSEKHDGRDSAFWQYLAQRYYSGSLCDKAPLFLVLGNHDGEYPNGSGRDSESLSAWSNRMRKLYFPNPVPDSFYSGNEEKHGESGLLQDFYSWEWGGSLFIALDPFWYSQRMRGKDDCWKRSLGEAQYRWLKRTLEGSKASFKFVFIHHLVGGLDRQSRGGTEAAKYFEWGGLNLDGTPGFQQNRPDWAAPIHQLLVQNHVNVVFHGHDHLYARQELDGVVYLEVPQPSDPKGTTRSAAEYGYRSGVILGSPGHIRVKISPSSVSIDYVRGDKSLGDSFSTPAKFK